MENPLLFLNSLIGYIQTEKENITAIINLINYLIINSYEQILEPEAEILRRNIADTLSKYLSHSDEEIRRICIELIFKVDHKNALVLADTMLDDEIVWNRLRVVELLSEFKFQVPENLRNKLLNDKDEMIKEAAQQFFEYSNKESV